MADPLDIISLADAKTHLNITTTNYDTELADFITAASYMWRKRVCHVIPETFNEWHDGGRVAIPLRKGPIQSIQHVYETYGAIQYELTQQTPGQSGSAYCYMVDTDTGIIMRMAAGVGMFFTSGYRNINVQYTAGFGPIGSGLIPGDIQLAIKLIVQHLWDAKRGGTKRPGMGGDDMPSPEAAYSWPQRAEEIADGYFVEGIA